MQEHQVTIGREAHRVPEPFLVLATQNPIETEGTYQLPEAQVDRFMLKVLVGYPSEAEEVVVVQRMTGVIPRPRPIITTEFLIELQREADRVYVDPQLMHFAVRLVGATRDPAAAGAGDVARYLTLGASPRASINLILGARALAMLRGRDYVLPRDLVDLAPDVLRHRLVLSYEALADGVSADAILSRLMACVPAPAQPLGDGAEPQHAQPGLRFERGA
jgi:MoxR-like ATPase